MRRSQEEINRAIARALVLLPRGSLTELAMHAGMSRATLYRFAPGRDAITEQLARHALERIAATLQLCDRSEHPVGLLERITEAFLQDRDLIVFLFNHFAQEEMRLGRGLYKVPEWEPLGAKFEAFFLNAQRAGVFSIEMPAAWMSDFYWSCLYGVNRSIGDGRIAAASAGRLLVRSFLRGVSAGSLTD